MMYLIKLTILKNDRFPSLNIFSENDVLTLTILTNDRFTSLNDIFSQHDVLKLTILQNDRFTSLNECFPKMVYINWPFHRMTDLIV